MAMDWKPGQNGKGSKRREGSNDKAYADNWERIFGNKDKKDKKPDPKSDPYSEK